MTVRLVGDRKQMVYGETEQPRASRQDRTGSAAYRGDGFYVWDWDERAAEAWARELAGDGGRVERVL